MRPTKSVLKKGKRSTELLCGWLNTSSGKGGEIQDNNNRLNYFIRILEHHARNGLLEKLPYTKGTSLVRLRGKQEKEDAEILPIEKLKGVYPHKNLIDPIAVNTP